jgi:zinc transporter 1/2/3
VVLLIAIIFHQTFEGLALGFRIAAISWPARSPQHWLMAVAYGCTTPLGQAIGITTHTLYSPNSKAGILVVGIINAISSEFLVFASLVELMSEDFLGDESWKVLRGKKRVIACLLVFFGAFLMSLIGTWA